MAAAAQRRQFPAPADRLADALAGMAAPALILDSAGRIEWSNAGAEALLAGVAAPGLSFADLCAPTVLPLQVTTAPVRLALPGAGAVDCELRSLDGGGWIATLTDADAEVRAAALAHRDALTGLANRRSFHERLTEELARARRARAKVAVLCIDLDRFKAVNDTLGHPVGDALLLKVAERLRSAARESDVIARLGGDEFAIIQTDGAQPDAAQALGRRLVDLIGRAYVANGHMLNIGASVGVAIGPTDGEDPDTLIKNADLAMYRAKSDGRGVFRFFEPAMDARMQSRRILELDLRKALALKEFELVYQPQVRLETGAVVGFEALLRWRQPERGFMTPAEFLPLAEEIGLITPIGEWVLRTACREAASWSKPVSVAVNLSAVQFRTGKLVETVTSALAQSGLDPAQLELEITESALLEDIEGVLAALNGVRSLGVRVSMDDFGTGYSSLSYLQKFPFDKIKIDQSFVRRLGLDSDSAAIIRAVATLGASLGMKTVAEGVETAEQLDRIRAEGCTDVQGYLTGRPLSPADAAALLRAGEEDLVEGAAA